MSEKKIQRKWALFLAILVTILSISQLMKDKLDISDTYDQGQLSALIAIPGLFYYLAFKKKKGK